MKRQRGVALITVLLVVAIVTVVCAGIIARQRVSIRATGNQLLNEQALHYALGGEALAQAVLLRDLKAPGSDPRNPVDHLLEGWARPLPVFTFDQGQISVHIEDMTGRFNLNSLVQDGKVNGLAVERFRRLLLRLGIELPYSERLVDWLDQDQDMSGENGAEDNQYLLLQPGYRTAGHAMEDVSELRLLLGMREEDYQRLLPYVAALPEKTLLNVNTASAMVLSSLTETLPPDTAQALIAARGKDGYTNIQLFLDQPSLAGTGIKATGLGIGSAWFEVRSEVTFVDHQLVLSSLLQRDAKGVVRVLRRDLGQPAAHDTLTLNLPEDH